VRGDRGVHHLRVGGVAERDHHRARALGLDGLVQLAVEHRDRQFRAGQRGHLVDERDRSQAEVGVVLHGLHQFDAELADAQHDGPFAAAEPAPRPASDLEHQDPLRRADQQEQDHRLGDDGVHLVVGLAQQGDRGEQAERGGRAGQLARQVVVVAQPQPAPVQPGRGPGGQHGHGGGQRPLPGRSGDHRGSGGADDVDHDQQHRDAADPLQQRSLAGELGRVVGGGREHVPGSAAAVAAVTHRGHGRGGHRSLTGLPCVAV
jgi:hypothetical protein